MIEKVFSVGADQMLYEKDPRPAEVGSSIYKRQTRPPSERAPHRNKTVTIKR
jgi:hypothetical protein